MSTFFVENALQNATFTDIRGVASGNGLNARTFFDQVRPASFAVDATTLDYAFTADAGAPVTASSVIIGADAYRAVGQRFGGGELSIDTSTDGGATWVPLLAFSAITEARNVPMLFTFASTTAQHWRFTIRNISPVQASYSLPDLWLGVPITIGLPEAGIDLGGHKFNAVSSLSYSGRRIQPIKYRYRRWNPKWNLVGTQVAAVDAMRLTMLNALDLRTWLSIDDVASPVPVIFDKAIEIVNYSTARNVFAPSITEFI